MGDNGGSGVLARTGSALGNPADVGLLLVLSGAAVLLGARHRRGRVQV